RPAPHLRPLLHHQARGPGHRPRPLHQLPDRAAARRRHPCHLAARQGHAVHGAPAARRGTRTRRPGGSMNDKANILFVDDEERVRRSLEMLFRSRFKVYTTTDGHEAVDIARRNRIHVVVSDQRMPTITGVEVLRKVREVSPNTMRLLLTGYSDLQAIVDS